MKSSRRYLKMLSPSPAKKSAGEGDYLLDSRRCRRTMDSPPESARALFPSAGRSAHLNRYRARMHGSEFLAPVSPIILSEEVSRSGLRDEFMPSTHKAANNTFAFEVSYTV